MTIADTTQQDKAPWGRGATLAGRIPKSAFVLIAILLAGAAGIGIGILVAQEQAMKKDPLWIEQLPAAEQANGALMATTTKTTKTKVVPQAQTNQTAAAAAAVPYTGEVVASKTGTAYYLPSCSGAARIKSANKVTFASPAAARAKGYAPAKNCKGL